MISERNNPDAMVPAGVVAKRMRRAREARLYTERQLESIQRARDRGWLDEPNRK